jgi:hypothetical protein
MLDEIYVICVDTECGGWFNINKRLYYCCDVWLLQEFNEVWNLTQLS